MIQCPRCGIWSWAHQHSCVPVPGTSVAYRVWTSAGTGVQPPPVIQPAEVSRWDQMRERWRDRPDR